MVYEPVPTLDTVEECPDCLRFARAHGRGGRCPEHEQVVCTCDQPTPRRDGILGWNEHECSTCHRPIL